MKALSIFLVLLAISLAMGTIADSATRFLLLALLAIVTLMWFFHSKRLKKCPPGPIGLPIVGYLPFLGAEPHKTLLKLSQKYGSPVISLRLGSKLTVVLNDYDTMKEVFYNPASLNTDPNFISHIPEAGFVASNGIEWQEQRRVTMKISKDLGLGSSSWQISVQEEVQGFIKYLSSYKGKPVDPFAKLDHCIRNNIISIVFGSNMAENDMINLSKSYGEEVLTYVSPLLPTTLFPWLRPLFRYLRITGYHRALEIIEKFHNIIRDEVYKHKTLPEYKDVHDFINKYLSIMEQKKSQKGQHFFTDGNLEGNAATLFVGAVDAIFGSLTWLFPLMVQYPAVQKKVHEELDEVIGKEGRITYEERNRIPYTFAVLMESQRFSTLTALSTSRIASADIEVKGYVIPKGSAIIANMWAIHNDSNSWEEPHKFIPERFLDTSGQKLLKTPPGLVAFSLGKRNCPGEVVAWMEIMAFFTLVLQKFEVLAPPGKTIKFETDSGLISSIHPQPFCFLERT